MFKLKIRSLFKDSQGKLSVDIDKYVGFDLIKVKNKNLLNNYQKSNTIPLKNDWYLYKDQF